MTEDVIVDPVETTEVDVDSLLTTRLAYVENLQKEIQGIQEQMASLQYQLDIRITAMTAYQSTLEVVTKEEPQTNGKDEEVKYKEKDLGDGLKQSIKEES